MRTDHFSPLVFTAFLLIAAALVAAVNLPILALGASVVA